MTREEFEAGYAARSGITTDELRGQGRRAVPCGCGADMCEGWAMERHCQEDQP